MVTPTRSQHGTTSGYGRRGAHTARCDVVAALIREFKELLMVMPGEQRNLTPQVQVQQVLNLAASAESRSADIDVLYSSTVTVCNKYARYYMCNMYGISICVRRVSHT